MDFILPISNIAKVESQALNAFENIMFFAAIFLCKNEVVVYTFSELSPFLHKL